MDWQALLYDPVYLAIGVSATVTTAESDGAYSLTVIDKTTGVEVGDGVQVATVKPAAVMRAREMATAGLSRDELDGSSLTMNGRTWRIEYHQHRPAPTGIGDGEVYLFLIEGDPVTA